MATFSTNQVRQFYVANSLATVAPGANVGAIEVGADTAQTHLYFKYMGAGGQTRSDLINLKSIVSAKATDADSMAHYLKKYKVSLDSTVNSGNPKAGQDYILRIAFRNFIGLSEEDQYFKYGTVHAVSNMTVEQFYTILLESLRKNFSRENSKLIDFYLDGEKATVAMTTNTGVTVTAKTLGTAGNSLKFAIAAVDAAEAGVAVTTASGVTTITASLTSTAKTIADLKALIIANATANALISISGTDATAVVAETTAVALTGGSTTGIIFEEVEQPWILGTMPLEFMNFTVQPTTINDGVEERIWGTVTELTPVKKIENGKMVADMEYFYMGERGDQYRNIKWPNTIKTNYLVNAAVKYNILDITYAYQGSGEDVQKSQKTITIAVPKVGSPNSVSNDLMNDLIAAINSATGLTIATLSVS